MVSRFQLHIASGHEKPRVIIISSSNIVANVVAWKSIKY